MKKFFLLIATIGWFALFLFTNNPAFASKNKKADIHAEKISTLGKYNGYSTDEYKGFDYKSYYVPMRDSILLAVDVFLPKKLEKGKKIPAIICQNRYVRSLKAKFPFTLFKNPVLTVVSEAEVKYFTSHGYAYVVVDTRGSGASTGTRQMDFSPEEIKDGAEMVDWIIKQSWCNGNVGTTGISYLGTTAELLLVNNHPNVKACIPRSSIFDLYSHIMYPGGVRQGCFVDVWGYTTRSLDNNDFTPFGKQAKRLLKGINPVDGDKKNQMLNLAVEQHKNNFNVYEGIKLIQFRDENHPKMGATADQFSAHTFRKQIEASGTPIFRIGGWYDGALSKTVVEGFMNTANTKRILIGPWDHGPHDNASPHAPNKEIDFDVYAEMLRFFDFYLKGIQNGIDKENPVNYFTVAEEKWNATVSWPHPQEEKMKLYLSADRKLVNTPTMAQQGTLDYKINYHITSGNCSRYNSVTGLYRNGPTHYADRKEISSKLLTFTAAPFEENTTITGHPVVDLHWSADANDAYVFVYLEDVGPDGSVTYITEGTFRPLHRKLNETDYRYPAPYHSYKTTDAIPYKAGETVQLTFDCIPTSYQIKKGHSLQISIAGADLEHFDLPSEIPSAFKISCGTATLSSIEIPVVSNKSF
jgi:putative CocE/NonD family hydrolase